MLTFLLGISISFNILFVFVLYLYLKVREHKELKSDTYIEDLEQAMDFFEGKI